MEEIQRRQIRELIQREVVVATGCTEPGAVALCVAKAVETLAFISRILCLFRLISAANPSIFLLVAYDTDWDEIKTTEKK